MRYTKDIYSYILHDKQPGKQFEEDTIHILSQRFRNDRYYRTQRCKIIDCTDKDMDHKAGTDFIYKSPDCTELRIDLTLRFEDKHYMPYIAETEIPATESQNFKIGIKHGNTHHGYTEFEKPVVVVGLSMLPQDYREHEDEILSNIMDHFDDLICEAQSAYESYTDKECIDEINWQKNPNYKRPRNLGRQYEEIENMIDSINHDNMGPREGAIYP